MCALKLGDVLEISSHDKCIGCAILISKDEFGHLFGISSELPDSQSFLGKGFRGVFYVNTAGIMRRWRRIAGVDIGRVEVPSVFNGTPATFWTLYKSEGVERIDAGKTSFEEMINRGAVHRVLWLPLNIEEYLLGDRELKWKWS